MHPFHIRPAGPDDFEHVLALIQAQNTIGYGQPSPSAADLRAAWDSPELDLARRTWAAHAPDGALSAYAELNPSSPGRFDLSLYLAGGPQQVELGSHLVQLAEQRAAEDGAPGEDATPLAIVSRVSSANLACMQVFADAGYTIRLSFLVMERSLAAPLEPPHWPPGIAPRPFIPGQDEQAVYQADEEASQDKGYHAPMSFEEWAARMSLGRPEFDPGLWFLACQGGEVAGVALNLYAADTQTAWVDHLGVRRAWRKQGLGKALLLHSFAEFQRRGIPQVRLSVDSNSLTNAPRLYAKSGMQTVLQYNFFKKELLPLPPHHE